MRRLTACLLVYCLLVTALFHIITPGAAFIALVIFFALGTAAAIVEHRNGIAGLGREIDLKIEKSGGEKNMLANDMKGSEGYISELRKKEAVIVSLYEITKKMSRGLTFNEIFDCLSVFLKENFTFKKSELLILRTEDGAIKIDRIYRVFKQESDEAQAKESDHEGILGSFSKDKKEIYVQRADGSAFGAIPLLSENKFVGILTIEDISKADFDRFLIVAMQFALEIKKVLLYETVEKLAITDSLTGLYTRRYFFERFDEELQRSKRHGFKFSFLMIDIDNFKDCNDTYGHLVGDVVLKEVARIAKAGVREIDLAARYGGEEFSLVLPETDRAGALLVAQRIRKKVEENIFKAYDEKLKVTVSIGVAVYPDDSQEMQDLIERADKALYAAKSSGKNIVCEYKE